MALKDALIAANLAGGSGGSGSGGGNVVIMSAYVENTEGYEGGFHKDDDTLYTYEELVALYESGATLMAYPRYYTGATVTVEVNHYEEGYEFSANVPTFSLDVTFGVFIDHAGYDNRVYPIGIKPLAVHFRVNGSPSSLTGNDIFVCDHQFSEIMAAMQDGREVIGVLVQGYAEQRMLPMMNAFAAQYSGVTFRDIKFINDGNLGWVMDVLTIQVNNKNNGTHTHSEQHQYSLTAIP